MTRFDTHLVREYYDRHSRTFVTFGQGGSLGTLHRAVWAPGVATRARAFRFVDDRIADLARSLTTANRTVHLVDLGCGVGGSLCYLATRLPMTGTGITLSARQARLASDRIRAAGVEDRVRVVEGDFEHLPSDIPRADLAFAIESFVHAPDPVRFFSECARLVRPGGLLLICDDVRRAPDGEGTDALDAFCRGWHVNTLATAAGLRALAEEAGFDHTETLDLTAWVEIDRPRDRVIALAVAALDRLGWRGRSMDPWKGGTALQTCLRNGWIGYELTVFTRR
jgi:SAM-dependent methyltransferase